jgi:hypothetical protein
LNKPLHVIQNHSKSISIKMDVCVCVCVRTRACSSITLERLERFRPNLVHILLLCMCKNVTYFIYIYIYIYISPKNQFPKGIWMIHVVEIKLLLLLGNRMVMTTQLATVGQTYPCKHIRGNVRYLVTWNIKQFAVGVLPKAR